MKKDYQTYSKSDKAAPMQKWLSSLSDDDLIQHMTFSFQTDKNGISHEYELLVEMLRLQSPPPTPIHPRAIGFKLATGGFINDGRNEFERVTKNRFRRPRLFQLIEKQQTDKFETSHGISSLPPEILALVKTQETVVHGSGKKVTSEWQNFDVIARKFEAPWGQVLSIGPTNTMRRADEQIMMCTFVQSSCRYIRCKGNNGQTAYCTFRKGKQLDEYDDSCSVILHLLHIVSRGRAFREPPRKKQGNIFASWFSPTTEWFSLPIFLASRFEVALWKSFEKHSANCCATKEMNERKTIIEEAFSRFSNAQTNKIISCAIVRSMRTILSTNIDARQLRDLMIHYLLHNAMDKTERFCGTFDFSRLYQIPIMFLSTMLDEFRVKVAQECELEISRVMEADLSRSEMLDSSAALKCVSVKKRKKKNKKKCRAKPNRTILDSIDEKKVEKYTSVGSPILNVPLPRDAYDEKKNQVTIFILGVINDIMDSVFREVGIASTDDKLHGDGFLLNDNCNKAKKNVNGENTMYILRKRTEKSISLTQPTSENDGMSNEVIQPNDLFFDNELTMKRNNTSASQSIWYTQSRLSSALPFTAYDGRYNGFLDLFTQPNTTEDQKQVYLEPDAGFSRYDEDFFYTNDNRSFFEQFVYDTSESQNNNFASSTAASLASSILDYDDSASLNECSDDCDQVVSAEPCAINNGGCDEKMKQSPTQNVSYPCETSEKEWKEGIDSDSTRKEPEILKLNCDPTSCVVQFPHAFLSLADLGELKRRASLQIATDVVDKNGGQSTSSVGGSKIVSSREDTETSIDDDISGKKKTPLCSARTVDFSVLSYKNAAMKSTRKARSVSSHDFVKSIKKLKPVPVKSSTRSFSMEMKGVIIDGENLEIDYGARSESALHDNENSSQFNVIPKSVTNNNDNITVTRDGATTISSIPAPHEIDEIVCLKEERDTYRDMCLSMAAEISKLKNMIALERINSNYTLPRDAKPFGSECIPSFHFGIHHGATRKYVAMSDTGFNDLPNSEDMCGDGMQSSSAAIDRVLQRVPHATNKGNRIQTQKPADCSDNMSVDYDNTIHSFPLPSRTIPYYKYSGSNHLHSLQSRLSQEIEYFVVSNTENLDNLERKRKLATERLNKLVTAIWPRAQLKAYGSQETGLRLPSSDLDFVLYLPEVHKKAPADAPGDLEGRNAINESSQKLLARKLKSESWIEPRSIKIIEHTVIPVIKFSTKDKKSESLQLDVSFDSKGHLGIQAVNFVKGTIENFPVIRPIVLVLKKFLLDKGLLTAYTGGLSSHCLFLMVTRYLQEQNLAWVDVGSLLMGFLDFYGNIFDPRIHGISVTNNGQYFLRPHHQQGESQHDATQRNELSRSKSFHDKNVSSTAIIPSSFGFDPLYVEDPISLGNNVGRNSFRINQIQRALSDAHRALVASLEWDMNCGSEPQERYPLLKCLTNS